MEDMIGTLTNKMTRYGSILVYNGYVMVFNIILCGIDKNTLRHVPGIVISMVIGNG